MKTTITFILLLFSCSLFAQIDTLTADSIKRMTDKDKIVRQKVEAAYKKYGRGSKHWVKAWDNMKEVDRNHAEALKAILTKFGTYPSMDKVGEEGAHNFWTLVLHQDRDTALQKQVVVWMKIPVDQGNASPNDYAYLVDRILVNAGDKQVYGTQCFYDETKKMYVPHPLQEPGETDKRREQMQLPPLAEYVKLLNEPKNPKK
ncbi:MAG: DUF6624 domain-containing protein [Bacteroidota bacterium]